MKKPKRDTSSSSSSKKGKASSGSSFIRDGSSFGSISGSTQKFQRKGVKLGTEKVAKKKKAKKAKKSPIDQLSKWFKDKWKFILPIALIALGMAGGIAYAIRRSAGEKAIGGAAAGAGGAAKTAAGSAGKVAKSSGANASKNPTAWSQT